MSSGFSSAKRNIHKNVGRAAHTINSRYIWPTLLRNQKWTASSRAISWPVVHQELWISATSEQCSWKRDELIALSKNNKIKNTGVTKSSPQTPRTGGHVCLTLAVFSAHRRIAVNMQEVGFIFILTVHVIASGQIIYSYFTDCNRYCKSL